MAVFVGGGEGLAAGRIGGIDEGEGGPLVLEVDEGARDAGVLGERQAEDAQAVLLDDGEDIPDGAGAEAEAAALVVGQALGRGVGVERGELQAAAGDVLELEVALAVAAEAAELGAVALGQGLAAEEHREGGLAVLEEEGDVLLEEGRDLLERAEGRRALAGLEEGDVLGREADGPGESALVHARLFAGLTET